MVSRLMEVHSGGDATLDPSPSVDGTRDRETDESTEPRSRSSSSPALQMGPMVATAAAPQKAAQSLPMNWVSQLPF